jgi:hypothetical protein
LNVRYHEKVVEDARGWLRPIVRPNASKRPAFQKEALASDKTRSAYRARDGVIDWENCSFWIYHAKLLEFRSCCSKLVEILAGNESKHALFRANEREGEPMRKEIYPDIALQMCSKNKLGHYALAGV